MFYVAGALLILAGVLSFVLDSPPALQEFVYVGGFIWVGAVVLIVLSIWTLRHRGKAQVGTDWTRTSVLVTSGVFAVVRHPLYLGWFLVYVALMLFSRHWLTVLVAIPGMVCVYLISRQEDRHLVEKFGQAYERYMQSVPGMNLVVGVIRLRGRGPRGRGTASGRRTGG